MRHRRFHTAPSGWSAFALRRLPDRGRIEPGPLQGHYPHSPTGSRQPGRRRCLVPAVAPTRRAPRDRRRARGGEGVPGARNLRAELQPLAKGLRQHAGLAGEPAQGTEMSGTD